MGRRNRGIQMIESEITKELKRLDRKTQQNHTLICEINDKLLGRLQELRQEVRDLKQEVSMLKVDLLMSGHEISYKE